MSAQQPSSQRSRRSEAILRAVSLHGHITEHYAGVARCTVGEVVVELMRLEREGLVKRSRNGYGMTWKAAA